ncbi:glutathione S-transferase family protein [Thalassospira marina]|uniref:Glutathione S-transferase n=1 Tax=Thalassospira marina TaxID=2048283 RepID=A0ABM6QEC1_9PROT|nr:glutathione S-transferase family protein [Thalassospira marina]AUG54846.1 glutathione S-transferase [Thalassospira marina]
MILHDFLPSGNGYKIRLMLRFLGREFSLVEHDITKGETRTDDYRKNVNPVGRIPALDTGEGHVLAESNAILLFLAEGTKWLPADKWERTAVYQWLFFEQYEHEPNVAVLRSWLSVKGTPDYGHALLPIKRAAAHNALSVMEDRLKDHDWLVGSDCTIADIALYAYTHVADEGGLDMALYPAIGRWLKRFSTLPAYVPITWKPE